MKIFCKEKDFYDYIGYQNGSEDVTFDRRDMIVITRGKDFRLYSSKEIGEAQLMNSFLGDESEAEFGLWIGHNLYIYRVTELSDRYDTNSWTRSVSPKFKYKIKLLDKKTIYDIPHKAPIEFVRINWRKLNYQFNIFRHASYLTAKEKEKYQKDLDNEILNGNVKNWELKLVEFDVHRTLIPILKDSFAGALDPSEVYYAIESWLISQHNDVDQESKGITDVEKAINHGFDKKSSFRNVK